MQLTVHIILVQNALTVDTHISVPQFNNVLVKEVAASRPRRGLCCAKLYVWKCHAAKKGQSCMLHRWLHHCRNQSKSSVFMVLEMFCVLLAPLVAKLLVIFRPLSSDALSFNATFGMGNRTLGCAGRVILGSQAGCGVQYVPAVARPAVDTSFLQNVVNSLKHPVSHTCNALKMHLWMTLAMQSVQNSDLWICSVMETADKWMAAGSWALFCLSVCCVSRTGVLMSAQRLSLWSCVRTALSCGALMLAALPDFTTGMTISFQQPTSSSSR